MMRQIAGLLMAALLLVSPLALRAQPGDDWPWLDHAEVAKDDAEFARLIEALRNAEGDDGVLDGWIAVAEHVGENYPLEGDFHLEILSKTLGIANFVDQFGRHDVFLRQRLAATLPLIEARFGSDAKAVADMRERLGWRYRNAGMLEEARALVGADHRMFGGNNDPDFVAPDRSRLVRLQQEAKSLSGEALIANLREQADFNLEDPLNSLGIVLIDVAIAREMARMGNLDQAIAYLRKVNTDTSRIYMDQRVFVGQYIAHYLQQTGDTVGAIAELDPWIAEYGDITPDSLWPKDGGLDILEPLHRVPQAHAQHAQLVLKAGADPQKALDSARYAAAFLRQYQATPAFGTEIEDEIAGSRDAPEDEPFGQDARSIYSQLVESAWRVASGDASRRSALEDEAFAAAQDASADSATAAIARTAADTVARRAGLTGLVDERRAIEVQLVEINEAIESLPMGDQEEIRLFQQYRRLIGRQQEVDFELSKAAPEFFQLIRPKPLSLEDTRALLGPGEAIVLIAPSEHATHVFALTRNETIWHRSELTNFDIADTVSVLRADLDPWGSGLAEWDGGFPLADAHRLYSELIAPLEDALSRANVDTLLFAADGTLATVPLTVLLTRAPDQPDQRFADFASLPWLADRYALSQIPSIASLAYLRRGGRESKNAGRTLASFGDPVLEGIAAQRGARSGGRIGRGTLLRSKSDALANVEQLRNLARLPGTRLELESLRDALGAGANAAILGQNATESAVKSADLSDARFIAFATHGLLAGQAGEGTEPGLVFTPPEAASPRDDGLLSSTEILGLELAADWVILSACNTAAGDGLGNEALSGMARAFFFAGARSLLASHWPVSDAIAPVLTVEAVTGLIDNPETSRAKALQRAMRIARANRQIDNAAHPSSWAAFINIGDPR